MKKIFFLTFLICFSTLNYAQDREDREDLVDFPNKQSSIYLELGGNSLYHSLNYDYTIPLSKKRKLAVGIGFEYVANKTGNKIGNNTSRGSSVCLTLPLPTF